MKANQLIPTAALIAVGLFAANRSDAQNCVCYKHLDQIASSKNQITYVSNSDTLIAQFDNVTGNDSLHVRHGFYKHEAVLHYNGQDYLDRRDIDDNQEYIFDRPVHVTVKPGTPAAKNN